MVDDTKTRAIITKEQEREILYGLNPPRQNCQNKQIFFQLIKKGTLNKLFIKNNFKISYSCMNIKKILQA